jgi:hypothetical protein
MSLAQADRPIADIIGIFSRRWIEVGLLVPTPTGLDKSIMDAHASLREFLKNKGLHDYGKQGQGAREHGVYLKTWLVSESGLHETKASLYRPESGSGDPRICIYGLAAYAKPGNVLALIADKGDLYVVNGSDLPLMASAMLPNSILSNLLARLSPKTSPAATELLGKLRDVASHGFIKTLRPGPTGVGFTLESMLGIGANSRKAPDFKGIEIKASRTTDRGAATTRTTLFSKTPDWKAGHYSALKLVQTYGRPNEDGRKQIYCSLDNKPNSTFGFYLATDDEVELLHSLRGTPGRQPSNGDEKLLQWPLTGLRAALMAKHRETFWVKAQIRGDGEAESFRYYEVIHTQAPLQSNFAPLIDSGHIELDFVIHLKDAAGGKQKTRDHGYLFKLWDKHRHLLFAEPRVYRLDDAVTQTSN